MAPAAHGATIGPGLVTVIGIIGGVILFGTALSRPLFLGIGAVLFGLACLAIAGSTAHESAPCRAISASSAVGLLWGFYPLLIQLWKVDG
jgi:hypothetical protein